LEAVEAVLSAGKFGICEHDENGTRFGDESLINALSFLIN